MKRVPLGRIQQTPAVTRQSGLITLLVATVLIVSSMLAMRWVSHAMVVDTRITSNEQRSKEVLHAAEAALDFGLAWYVEGEPAWSTSGSDEIGAPSVTVPGTAASNGDTYASAVTYRRDASRPDFIMISATSTAVGDSAVSATVRQYVHTNLLLSQPTLLGPPLVIDGCLGGVTGTPDIYPEGPGGVAVATSSPTDCLDEGHLGYNGGAEQYGAFAGDIWDYMFKVPREDMKSVADAEVAAGVADADRTVVWVTSTSNYHKSWGSPTNPVVLVFAPAADCPKINGSPTIYGVVFVDSPCDGANGWGGTEVFGSVAVNGDISKVTANTEITHWNQVGGGDPYNLKLNWVARIPGSWRDF